MVLENQDLPIEPMDEEADEPDSEQTQPNSSAVGLGNSTQTRDAALQSP